MPRSIWSGAISFGLVNVPVKVYSAVSPKTVRFHQLNRETNARIQQKRVDATTGDEVAYEQLVKGYEIAPDRYVVITPEELDALAPDYLKRVPGDLFSGKALIYRPAFPKTVGFANGYLLYSVGVNGKDEGGRTYGENPPGDDLPVRMPLPELRRP